MENCALRLTTYCDVANVYEVKVDDAFVAKAQAHCNKVLHPSGFIPAVTKEMITRIWAGRGNEIKEYLDIEVVYKKWDCQTRQYTDEPDSTDDFVGFFYDYLRECLYDNFVDQIYGDMDDSIEEVVSL